MDKKSAPVLTKDQTAYIADTNRSTAARIKFLAGEGFSRADIARAMTAHSGKTVSYQWVKNVLDKVA
jgi:glutathione S-transferase